MAKIIHNISFPNDGLGDTLREAFDNQNQMNSELYNDKVDKSTGKDLSENDFTDADKLKLDGIEEGAQVNVIPDFLQNDPNQPDFIKNKPIIVDNSNAIISQTGSLQVGQDITFYAGWNWKIYGINYTNTSDEILNIPLANTGLERIDYIVPTIYGNFSRIIGAEVASNPVAPILPNGGIYATFMLVTDSLVGETLPSLMNHSTYKGKFNATTNALPTLINGTGQNGDYLEVAVAGTTDFGAGAIAFLVGDWIHYNGFTGEYNKWISAYTGGSGVASVTAGTNVTVTGTPTNPIINSDITNATETVAGKVSVGSQTLGGNKTIVGESATTGNALTVQNLSHTVVAEISNLGDSYFNGVRVGKGKGSVSSNTTLGKTSLNSNTTGLNNTANGFETLVSNTTGSHNTAVGSNALKTNIVGSQNTAVGVLALGANKASGNTAVGMYAMNANNTGANNTAIGLSALQNNTGGNYNMAVGDSALILNTNGTGNLGIGQLALQNNLTGSYNIALGASSGRYISGGVTVNSTTDNSIYIGSLTKALANNQTNQIVIGYDATGAGSNTATIGNASIVKTVLRGVIAHSTSYTVATLPTGTLGDTAFVTDAVAPTYLGALTGGGSVTCPVFHNGTIWISH